MKVALVNPPQNEKASTSTFGINPGTAIIPYNLLCLASYLRSHGHECDVIDGYAEGYDSEALEKVLADGKYAVVGVTSFTVSAPWAFKVADSAKKALPGCMVVYGGIHATVCPEKSLEECPSIDCIVKGEGEIPLLGLVEALENDLETQLVKSTVWRDGKGGYLVQEPSARLDMSEIPMPDYSLLNMAYYKRPHAGNYKALPTFSFYASRGCPFQCAFCSATIILGRKVRYKSLENAIAEIELLTTKYGAKGLNFQDSSFTVNRQWCLDFCNEIVRRGIKLKWRANTRADCLDAEVLSAMKAAGCYRINVGFESGNESTLKLLKKQTTVALNVKAARLVQEAGMELGASFLVGVPGEGIDEVVKTIEFACKVGCRFTQFYLPIPYPGTRLREMCEGPGLRKDAPWEDYLSRNIENPVYINDNFSPETYVQLPKAAYRHFYFNLKSLARQLSTICSLSEFRDWMRVVKAAMIMGFTGREFRLSRVVKACKQFDQARSR